MGTVQCRLSEKKKQSTKIKMRLPFFVFVVLLVGLAAPSPVVIEDPSLSRTTETLTSTTETLTSSTEGLTSTTETLTSTEEGLTSTTGGLTSTTETLTSTTETLTSTTEDTLISTSTNSLKTKFKISVKSLFNDKLIPIWKKLKC